MPIVVQACIVVVTLALVALTAATVRIMLRLEDTADRIARLIDAAQIAIAQAARVGREAEELVATLRELTTPVKVVAGRFSALGERAASLSAAVLDEVEAPVRTALALSRGVKTGTSVFIEQVIRRFSRHVTSTNGDTRHELDPVGRP